MKDKVWEIQYRGHRLRAINRFSIFPPSTSEALEIDGVKVLDAPGSLMGTTATHFARHVLDGKEHVIELRFANEQGGFGMGCEVFVDGEKAGGTRAILYPDPEESKRRLAKGFLHYFLTYGLPRFGLPYAIFMLLALTPDTPTKVIWTFAFHALGFGAFMSWFFWRGLVNSAKVRAAFEAGSKSR